jgi:thiol-disulfide isomerase/thioredoxin
MKSLIGAIIVSLCLAAPLSAELATPKARKAAPDFTLRDANGAAVRLKAFKGKVVLLDFWATWCAPCKLEIPWFIEFQEAYSPRGMSSIGIAMDDEGWKTVGPYLTEHPISYLIVTTDAKVAKGYRVTSLPVTLLIDRNGKIAARHDGLVDRAAFERDLRTLLDEKASR